MISRRSDANIKPAFIGSPVDGPSGSPAWTMGLSHMDALVGRSGVRCLGHRMAVGAMILISFIRGQASAPNAEDIIQPATFPHWGFSLVLPSGWQTIPEAVIEEHNRKILAQTGKPNACQFGFQLASNQDWFAFPYLLGQVNTQGCFSAAEIRNISRPWPSSNLVNQESTGTNSRWWMLLNQVPANDLVFDGHEMILWRHFMKGFTNEGVVCGLSGMRLTRQGTVTLSGYAWQEDFIQWAPVFERTIGSVQLADRLVYRLDLTAPTVGWGNGSLVVLVLFPFGLVVLLLFWWALHRE